MTAHLPLLEPYQTVIWRDSVWSEWGLLHENWGGRGVLLSPVMLLLLLPSIILLVPLQQWEKIFLTLK